MVAVGFACESQIDEPIHQLCVGESSGFPQLGIHADAGEARNGVELVEQDAAAPAVEKEVDARVPGRADGLERLDRKLPDLRRLRVSGDVLHRRLHRRPHGGPHP